MSKRQPTPQQMAALTRYAMDHGRNWKSQLNNDWMNGQSDGYLQQVRNEFGPRWLLNFKLTQA